MNALQSPRRLTVVSALSLLGAIAAGYLSKVYYDLNGGHAAFKSMCNISARFNCDVVAASPYAEIFNGLPLSSVVSGWMVAILIVSLIARHPDWRRDGIRIGALFAFIGLVLSVVYLYIMMVLVQTFCVVCLALDVINVLIFALFWSMRPAPMLAAPFDRTRLNVWLGVPAASLFVVAVLLRSFSGEAVSEEMISSATQSVLGSAPVSVGGGPEFPTLGKADAPITIVEFSDLQCPACRIGAMILKGVLARHPNDAKVVFRAYPLDSACNRKMQGRSLHPVACESTRVLFCAAEQGKFEPVYESLFERQAELVTGKAAEIALGHGVDKATLDACVAKESTAQKLARDVEEGITLGVESTPTFFINGHRVQGAYPLAVWSRIIEQLKAKR